MKTIITQKIDGYDIIVGLGEAQIDPVATEKITSEEIKKNDLYKQAESIRQEMETVAKHGLQSKKLYSQVTDQSEKSKYWDEYRLRYMQVEDLGKKLQPIIDGLSKTKVDLMYMCGVYFTPKQGEEIVTDEFYENVKTALQNSNGFVDKNLNEICDNRGKVFWKKVSAVWLKDEVHKIGKSPKSGYLELKDLDEKQVSEIKAQIEKERLSKLTVEQKRAEIDIATKSIVSAALTLRGELEITKDSESLIKAQDFYETELAKIKVKYL